MNVDLDFSLSSSDSYEPMGESDDSQNSSSSSLTSNTTSSAISSSSQKNKVSGFPINKKQNANKKHLQREKRLKGKAYVSITGLKRQARPLLPSPCLLKRNHKCGILVKEENRIQIYSTFRKLTSIDDQTNFILNHVHKIAKKRVTRNIEHSRRTFTNCYSFTVDGEKRKVCREFFMATINVTDSFIRSALRKTSSFGALEKNRKRTPHNKLKKDEEKLIHDHILSFPAIKSHYCRSSTQKKYLDPSLNTSIMYRMYKDLCLEKNIKVVSFEKYRIVFKSYNLGFFKPKKDQCKKCLAQENLTESQKEEGRKTYEEHIQKKNMARKERDNDKQKARENSDVLAFNFDLEAVLTTPKGSAGQIFYLRKLAIYNLTVYNLGNQDGVCYLWDETQGKRGSNEIASCIYNYVLSHPETKEVTMMSDGCGGQQKNSNFSAMCLRLISVHPNLNLINHKFFETGHTEMECDSIHSKIEKKAKFVPVYTPEGWAQIIRSARMNPRPFQVNNLTFEDFYDFKTLCAEFYNMSKIPWRRICWLCYKKEEQLKIYCKTNYNEEFIEIKCSKTYRGRPKNVSLKTAYNSELPISKAKFGDLQKMCRDMTIPKIHHKFYASMKVCSMVPDKLPEPDESEDTATDDD